MTISNEAVEKAAEWLPHSGDCEARPERDCTCWGPHVDLMRAALEAAAGIIRAEALEEAAKEMDRLDALGNTPYWDLTHEQGSEYREWAGVENEQAWLRARALAERGEPSGP